MTPKDVLDYAWDWFEYHAGQRMVAFRFFLILLSALVLGVATVLKDGQYGLASAVAGFGAFISFAFLMLELRNEALVNVGRTALLYVERSDEALKATPLQLLHSDRNRSILTSHKLWLRAIYTVSAILFLIAAVSPRIVLGQR
jgi:hypothetical protein